MLKWDEKSQKVMMMSNKLTKAQSLAIEYITNSAKARKAEAQQIIEEVLYMSDTARERFHEASRQIYAHAKVALHLHPDRPITATKTVADDLLAEGIYKNQFQTRISNGGLTAYPGGARDEWEKAIFGGAYHQASTAASERPKYGALELLGSYDGPAPRFGSCYVVLHSAVSKRCTFTYLDSSQNPKEKGTFAEFDDVLAALWKDVFFRNEALGRKELTPELLLEQFTNHLPLSRAAWLNGKPSRNLDYYIEAQVHGDIVLQEDAEALVADPSFQGTATGQVLEQLCSKYGLDLYWHRGLELHVGEVPSNFRGPAMPALAKRIEQHGKIDAHSIGLAAASLMQSPELWKEYGSYEQVVQQLKYMWHILVRFGQPKER